MIEVPISHGDLVDRLTILAIKCTRLQGETQQHAQREQALLSDRRTKARLQVDPTLEQELNEVNQSLWDVEDQLRLYEQQQRFDDKFIALARAVYQLNDRRAALKRRINLQSGSGLIEAKSYGTPITPQDPSEETH